MALLKLIEQTTPWRTTNNEEAETVEPPSLLKNKSPGHKVSSSLSAFIQLAVAPLPKKAVPGEYDGAELLLEVIGDAVEYAVDSGLNAKDVNSFFNVFTTVLTSIIQNGTVKLLATLLPALKTSQLA